MVAIVNRNQFQPLDDSFTQNPSVHALFSFKFSCLEILSKNIPACFKAEGTEVGSLVFNFLLSSSLF